LKASATMLFRRFLQRLPHWQKNLSSNFLRSTNISTLAKYDHTWLCACIVGGILKCAELQQMLLKNDLIISRVYSRKVNNNDTPEARILLNMTLLKARQRGGACSYATGMKLFSLKSGKQSVTNEDLVKQLMSVARQSLEDWQRLKKITLMKSGRDSIVDFIKDHLSTIAFDAVRRWEDKAPGQLGVKSLLIEAFAKEEGPLQQAPPGTHYTGITIAGQPVFRPRRCAQAISKEEGSKQPPLPLIPPPRRCAQAISKEEGSKQPPLQQAPPGTHYTGITIAGQPVYRPHPPPPAARYCATREDGHLNTLVGLEQWYNVESNCNL